MRRRDRQLQFAKRFDLLLPFATNRTFFPGPGANRALPICVRNGFTRAQSKHAVEVVDLGRLEDNVFFPPGTGKVEVRDVRH